jgi:hypothetical protein
MVHAVDKQLDSSHKPLVSSASAVHPSPAAFLIPTPGCRADSMYCRSSGEINRAENLVQPRMLMPIILSMSICKALWKSSPATNGYVAWWKTSGETAFSQHVPSLLPSLVSHMYCCETRITRFSSEKDRRLSLSVCCMVTSTSGSQCPILDSCEIAATPSVIQKGSYSLDNLFLVHIHQRLISSFECLTISTITPLFDRLTLYLHTPVLYY